MSAGADSGTNDSGPDIPEKGWTNPFAHGSPMWRLFEKLVRQERDLIIVLDDHNAGRGTGKTVASLLLANAMNQHGTITREHVAMEPEAIRNCYTDLPKRSGIVLDEGEVGASNRQAMTKVNQALREICSMGRVQEKYLIINTPIRQFIDKDIQKLADVWISMTKKGEALVHFLDWNPYAETLLNPKKQRITFDDIPPGHELRDVYNYLAREKLAKMDGADGSGYVPREQHQEELQKAREEARLEQRNEDIRGFWSHEVVQDLREVSQEVVGESVGVSQSTVSNIVN